MGRTARVRRATAWIEETTVARQKNQNQKNDKHPDDLPPGLASPARRALLGAGYTRLDQLARVREAELLKLHGMGPKAIGVIRSALEARGLSFADPARRRRDI